MSKHFTYSDVSEHGSKKDCYVVIHDKVYNVTTFVDEHPGGEEVLLDVAGQDATEAFEDVGHSDEAREILHDLIAGELERSENDPKPKSYTETHKSGPPSSASSGSGFGMGLYALILIGGLLAFGAYQYSLQQQKGQ